MTTKFYRIRSKTTGLFQTGGMWSKWHKTGKFFRSLGTVRSHITAHLPTRNRNTNSDLGEWEIVEYDLVELSVKNVHEVITADRLVEMLTGKKVS